jgi:hypothetical protein
MWLKGSSVIQMGPEYRMGGLAPVSEGRRLSICLGKYVTVFQAEIYAILACVWEIQSRVRSERYLSICSDSQAALEALQAVKTTSRLVRQCQKALDNISTYHSVGLLGSPDIQGYMEMKLPISSQGRALPTTLWDQSRLWGSQGNA